MKIKICGMKYPENIAEVAALLPDFMGFICYEKSARFFDGEMPELPKLIKKVGVFVNENHENIVLKIAKFKLDFVQLHGNESVAFCRELQDENIKIIKVFSINDDFDFSVLQQYESVCDYFLFDTKGLLPGGNGVTFNWDLLKNAQINKPLFLSGGIGIDEIERLKTLNLPIFAIDINSKFEDEIGLKNIEKLTVAKQLVAKKTS